VYLKAKIMHMNKKNFPYPVNIHKLRDGKKSTFQKIYVQKWWHTLWREVEAGGSQNQPGKILSQKKNIYIDR
jgi:hypothetical protein